MLIKIFPNTQGDIVATFGGRYICSSRSPLREAQAWANSVSEQLSSDCIVVLGLGLGYHILELHRRQPGRQIVVIEKHDEFIEHFKSHNKLHQNINLIKIQDPSSVEVGLHVVQSHYQVFKFLSAMVPDPEFYQGIEKFALCRELSQLKCELVRRGVNKLLVEQIAQHEQGLAFMNLKNISQDANLCQPGDKIIAVLREFVT